MSNTEILMEPVARLQGVTKKIGSKTLVSDLTLDIPPGQIFGFWGPTEQVRLLQYG